MGRLLRHFFPNWPFIPQIIKKKLKDNNSILKMANMKPIMITQILMKHSGITIHYLNVLSWPGIDQGDHCVLKQKFSTPVVVDRDATVCNRLADDIYAACLRRS